jgi:hypothetical protein
MTLRMADGPVANIPPEFNAPGFAVAGYVNKSGIGITYPGVVAKFPIASHLSITTDGAAALCADVESGAMSKWTNYTYGYCSVSNVNALIAHYGRPKKLWTAHQDKALGAHICSPACWPGLVTTADGTQWIDHGGWDESLLADDFFFITPAPPPPTPSPRGADMLHSIPISTDENGNGYELTTIPWADFEAATIAGSYPAPVVDGGDGVYWFGTVRVQDRNNVVCVSVTGCQADSVINVFVLATQ